MTALLAIALTLAVVVWLFGAFVAWATFVTMGAVLAFVGFWWIIGEGR